MKKTITLFAISLASSLLADYPSGNSGNYQGGNQNYQNPSNPNYYQNRDSYYQDQPTRQDQSNRNDYYQKTSSQSSRSQNQSYYQEQPQGSYDYSDKTGNYDNRNIYDNRGNMNERSSYGDKDSKMKSAKYPQDYAATESDRALNAKIRDKLSGWFTNDYEGLSIRTTNGVVTITGTVDKVDDIQKINDKLKDINGITSVNNQVTAKSNK